MELLQLISELNRPQILTDDAILELIDRKDESAPALLDVVASVFNDYKVQAAQRVDFIFALYILSYFRESLAFPYVIDLALMPADWIEKILGDHESEGLASWLVSTYNGDLDAIKGVIENETAASSMRCAAIRSLVGLFAIGALSRESIIEYLKVLLGSDLVNDYEFATEVVCCARDLYPQELNSEIRDLMVRDMIDETVIGEGCIYDALIRDKQEWLKDHAYSGMYHLPITDVIDRVDWMIGENPSHAKKMDSFFL